MAEIGSVVWSELNTHDVARAKAHYAAVMGWSYTEAETPDGPYVMAMKGDAPVMVGIFDLGDLVPDVPDHWITYVSVADVDAAAAATEADGGTVLRAPFDMPGTGRIAVLKDPGGGVYGVMTVAEEAG